MTATPGERRRPTAKRVLAAGPLSMDMDRTVRAAYDEWPAVHLPENRGGMSAADVLAVPAGTERDKAIDAWCQSVWTAFSGNREMVIALLREYQIAS